MSALPPGSPAVRWSAHSRRSRRRLHEARAVSVQRQRASVRGHGELGRHDGDPARLRSEPQAPGAIPDRDTHRRRNGRRVVAMLGLWLVICFPGRTAAAAQSATFSRADLQAVVDTLDVVDVQGRRWTAADLVSRVILIDFWASWCAPCLAQVPQFKRLRAEYGPAGFEVLAISLDSTTRRDFVAWLNRQAVSWPQVHDGRGFSSPAARRFGVRALPASLLVVNARIVARDLRGPELDRAIAHFVSTSSFDAARMPMVSR
jgi:thiol-disulfide isomerase/thioredoxin